LPRKVRGRKTEAWCFVRGSSDRELRIVDEILRLYIEVQPQKHQARAEELRTLIEARIDELEEFYLEHDDGVSRAPVRALREAPVEALVLRSADERAVLFEKQRLRLRRALQIYSQGECADPLALVHIVIRLRCIGWLMKALFSSAP
jgi:hypothetical protein